MVKTAKATAAAIEVGKRLRAERKRQRKTQKDVASAVECAQQTVLDLELGKVEWSRYLPAIADELGVSMHWLETGEGPPARPEAAGVPIGVVTWDFFTKVAAKDIQPVASEWLDGCPVKHSGDCVALVADEAAAFAMQGEVNQGDWLFVDRRRADNGLVICMMAGWHAAEVRELTSMGGRFFLKSSNPALPQALLPVSIYSQRDEYRAALQVPGQDTLPCLVLGRVVFQGVPR